MINATDARSITDMTIRTEWLDLEAKRVIILEFTGDWDLSDYDTAIEHSIQLLNEVKHPVAMVIDLSQSEGPSRSADVFKKWQEAIARWRETDNYADFWVSVEPNYWEYFLIWLLSRIYNPTSMEVVKNSQEAYQHAIKILDKLAETS